MGAEETTNQTPETEPNELEGAISGETEAQEEVEAAQQEEETAEPTLETISKEEHERVMQTLKGGHAGTVQKMRGEIEQLTTQISELQTQLDESNYSNWLRAIEEKGGDVDFAKQTVDADRKVRQLQAQLKKKEQELSAKETDLNEAAIGKTAHDLLTEHHLGKEHLEALINEASGKTAIEGRLAMENLVLKLSMQTQRAKATPQVKTDKADGKPAPPNWEGRSDSEIIGLALEEVLRDRQ